MTLPSDTPMLVAIGLLTGVLSGLFGVGGGFLLVPALMLMGWELPRAVGTSLFYVTVVGVAGAISHTRRGNVDRRLVLMMALPAVVGAQGGALLADWLPVSVQDVAFGVLLLYAAFELGNPKADQPSDAPPAAVPTAGLGLLVGVLSGMLGVGGGVLLVPAQTRWLRVGLVRAIGNSLAVVVLTGLSGVAAHLYRGHVDGMAGLLLIAGGLVGVRIGLVLLSKLPVPVLKRAFMGFLVLLSFYMAAKGLWPHR